MAKYARTYLTLEFSDSSDFSTNLQSFKVSKTDITPEYIYNASGEAATGAATSIDLSALGHDTFHALFFSVPSTSGATEVTLTWTTAGSVASEQQVQPGEFIYLSDVAVGTALTVQASGAASDFTLVALLSKS